MSIIIEQFISLWNQALAVWISGGWCMPPIALTAMVMFAIGTHTYLSLRKTGFQSVPEKNGGTGLIIRTSESGLSGNCSIL